MSLLSLEGPGGRAFDEENRIVLPLTACTLPWWWKTQTFFGSSCCLSVVADVYFGDRVKSLRDLHAFVFREHTAYSTLRHGKPPEALDPAVLSTY